MAEFDINSILSSLSPEDISNLKETAMSLLGGAAQEGGTAPVDAHTSPKEKKPEGSVDLNSMLGGLSGLSMPDLSQLSALAPVLQAFNSKDERIEFINALKPLLSNEKQKKADEAMKLVRLMSVLPLLRERGLM